MLRVLLMKFDELYVWEKWLQTRNYFVNRNRRSWSKRLNEDNIITKTWREKSCICFIQTIISIPKLLRMRRKRHYAELWKFFFRPPCTYYLFHISPTFQQLIKGLFWSRLFLVFTYLIRWFEKRPKIHQ